ncbi:PD-(D/E)XK nuclease family protein [Streptomyces sp. DSM 44915]|uniref:PD-(D/E)XK nuclease family protein n=1 Tax=Streptomyces chisholmiae TaxID=3075540 RepID=A0ABU2JY56_9ACTN|nr:PD-(D/E)XK nuclease family protein [Streptomyces sp. DSM 44915]MDT0269936.1 PD-(D/E)XK nuclease family protein [Streptomyces sp. DSM 44915]
MTRRTAAPPRSLSPSRAADFQQCPLLYRFRVIDKLPERPNEAATRGTVVHAVLERLFDAPAGERSVPRARALVAPEWRRLLAKRPELAQLFGVRPAAEPGEVGDGDGEGEKAGDAVGDGAGSGAPAAGAAGPPLDEERLAAFLAEAERLVERWFALEDPTRLEPAERELFVETTLPAGLRLRGVIDRVDVAPGGEIRIVDYKTGKAPPEAYAGGALFQMKFYALVLWRLRGVVPRRLQLVYLGSGEVLSHDPEEAELLAVERKVLALWDAISRATDSGDWRPRRGRLCSWCDHQSRCPEFGGTPPPYPLPVPLPLPEQAGGGRESADAERPAAGGAAG